jgi:hypothetical protein
MLSADGDQGDTVTLRHLKSRHGECRDLELTFHRRYQRFTSAASDKEPRQDRRKQRQDIAAAWERTGQATDGEGDEEE